MERILIVLFIILILLILAVLGASIYFFFFALVRRKKIMDITNSRSWQKYADLIREGRAWIENKEHDKVEIESFDGLKLRGRFLPNGDSKKTILLMHGYRSCGKNDFGCVAEYYYSLGFNLLIVDQRAHGESEGRYITFGVRERYDCTGWVKYLNSRIGEDSDIFLDGISMGAATVLMASGLDLPENVRGIIADCGFTSPYDIFCHVLKRDYHLPPFPLIYTTDLLSRIFAGFSFKEYSTVEAMKKNKLPVIFVHGEDDTFVPARMSIQTHDACTAEKEISIVSGARHGMSYLVDTENCQKKIKAFFERYSTK